MKSQKSSKQQKDSKKTTSVGQSSKRSKVSPETIQLQRLSELLEVTQSISALRRGEDPKVTLERVVETANKVLNADVSVIFPYEAETDTFRMDRVVASGVRDFDWAKPRPKGATRKILERGDLFTTNLTETKTKDDLTLLLKSGDFERILKIQAVAATPLLVDSEKLGVLYINYKQEHLFDANEKDAIKRFANTVALILNNSKIYERESQALQLAEQLRDASNKITQASDRDAVLTNILDGALRLTRTTEGVIYLLDRLQTKIMSKVERSKGFHTPPRLDKENSVTRTIIKTGKPYLVEDVKADEHVNPTIRGKMESTIGYPLKDGENVIGILYLNYFERHTFHPAELAILEKLSEQAVIAIRNFDRIEVTQRIRRTVTEIVSAHSDLETTCNSILTNLKEFVPYDGAILHLLEGEWLVVKSMMGFEHPEEVRKFRLNMQKDRVRISSTRAPVVISDVEIDERWTKVPGVDWVHGWLGIPLIAGGGTIGHIGLYKREKGFFTPIDSNIALEFSIQAAASIENAQYSDRLQAIRNLQQQILEGSNDLDYVLEQILKSMLTLLNVEVGQILLLNESRNNLIISATTPESKADKGREISVEECVSGFAVKEKKPIRVADVTTEEPYKKVYKSPRGREGKFHSELAVPLIVRGNVTGALSIEHEAVNHFSKNAEDLLVTIANITALAIESAKSSVRDLGIIKEVQESILTETFDRKTIFKKIANLALPTTSADSAEVWLVEGEMLENEAVISPYVPEGTKPIPLSIDDSVCGIAVKTRQAQRSSNVKEDERYKKVYKPVSGQEMVSELVVPLFEKDNVIGVINVESKQANAFTQHHEELLKTLATEAAVAIRAAQRQQELDTIADIQEEILGKAFEREEVFNLILRRGLEIIDATLGQVLVVEGEKLVVQASTAKQDISGSVFTNNSVSGIAVLEKRVVRVGDVQTEQPYNKVYQPILGKLLHSELVVPLIIEDDVIGVLNIEHEKPNAFTEEDGKLLTNLARQAALAIRLSDAFAEVEVLRDIQDNILTGKYTKEEAYKEILTRARTLIGSETGQLLLLQGEKLAIVASTNEKDIGTKVLVNDSISGLGIQEPINIADVTTEKYRNLYKKFLGPDMHSELVVPLRVGNEIVGVLNAESPRMSAFTRHHVEILSALAGQAAMAIRTAEQLELQKRAAEADKMLAAGQIVHRLAGRAGAIRADVGIIRGQHPELQNDATAAQFLEDMDQKAGEILDLVQELKKRAAEPLTLMDVAPLLDNALGKINIPDKIVVSKTIEPDLPKVKVDPALEEVFWNLFTNATEVMPDGGRLDITANISPEQHWINISIKDSGPGIPPAFHELIFSPNFASDKGDKHKSTESRGLGLWWSRACARAMGGKILLESQSGKGACFIVQIPIPQN